MQDLNEVIANFDPIHPPPYIIGYPKDSDPAYGWVQALKREGLSLWAKGTQIHPQFDETIKEGRYRKQTVRFMLTPNGWKLLHISFLDAVPPVIPGLNDNYQFNRSEIADHYDFIF